MAPREEACAHHAIATRRQAMDLPTLRRHFEVAEELYAAGHRLHAFAVLHALLSVPAAIPPCYRREEILCRVRAAEMLLPASAWPSRGDERAGCGRSRSSTASSTTVARLDLVQAVLSSMLSTRSYFENAVVSPLLWACSNNNTNINTGTLKKEEQEGADWNNGGGDDDGEEEEEEEEDSRVVPVALVVKAYVLSAIVHRQRLRHTQAVRYLEAAQQWGVAVFKAPLAGLAAKMEADSEMIVQQEEERRCCEALLNMELCRVFYSQLMSTSTPVAARETTSTAALHNARAHALHRLLSHAKSYASYTAPVVAGQEHEGQKQQQQQQQQQQKRRFSSACLSSPDNSFSIRAVARVLGYYYCTALVFDHRVAEAERHMQQCEVFFGAVPEMYCVRRLLAAGHRGPLAGPALPRGEQQLRGKRQRTEEEFDGSREAVKRRTSSHEDLRWLSDGFLEALRTYMALHAAVATTMAHPSHNAHGEVEKSNNSDSSSSSTTTTTSGNSGTKVRDLFRSTLHCIDAQLTQLTTATACGGATSNARPELLHSSPSADIRFLVLLKCAALVTMSGYALSQMWLAEGVQRILQLRRYMAVFNKHTAGLQVHYHLLASQLALMLSLRHLPGVGEGEDVTGFVNEQRRQQQQQQQQFTETEEAESTAGFDVGLPYAHVRAAEKAALHVTHPGTPSTLLLVTLMKCAALYHTAHTGSALHLDRLGLTLGTITVHQRHRCATALIDVLETLKASLVAASVKEDEEGEGKEEEEEEKEGNNVRQLRCAWTVSNHVLLLLLRGVTALVEERDEFSAICTLREAAGLAKQRFGLLSGVAAECLQLLALAHREYEQVQLQLPQEPTAAAAAASQTIPNVEECLCTDTDGRTDKAQQVFALAWHVASRTSRLAKLHCALSLCGGAGKEECMRILEEWNTEVRRVCLTMRRELTEVLSL